jgi:hypothetical protein
MHVRICRECGEEYRPEVVVCSDCGGALEDRYEGIESSPDGFELRAAPPAAEFSTSPLLPIATAASAAEIEPLGRLLDQAGVRFAVRGSIRSFELLVAADDHEPALAALEAGAGGDVASTEPIASCPACETKITQMMLECPECGLGLGTEEASATLCCARCGQPRVGGLPCACSTGE